MSKSFRSIEFEFSPEDQYLFSQSLFDNDLFIFIDTSVSYPNFSPDSLLVIGGRSADCAERSDSILKLTDVIRLHPKDRSFLISSLYKSRESYSIMPLEEKTLIIYNRLFRSNGLGLAFVFNFPPECVASIIDSDYASVIKNTVFSSRFSSIAQVGEASNDFLNSFAYFSEKLSYTAQRSDPSKKDIEIIFDVITAVSAIVGCVAKISLPLSDNSSFNARSLDVRNLFSFLLCILSSIRASAIDRTAEVSVYGSEYPVIKIVYKPLPARSDSRLREMDYCNKMSRSLGIPFSLEINDGVGLIEFVPLRIDPSLSGFKSGIYIDGKLYHGVIPEFISY